MDGSARACNWLLAGCWAASAGDAGVVLQSLHVLCSLYEQTDTTDEGGAMALARLSLLSATASGQPKQ